MRVLHVVKTSVGASWVFHQVRVLLSQGVEVVVAVPSATDGFAPRYRDLGATVVETNLDFPIRQPWKLPHVIASCRNLVKRTNPDLIHLHFVGAMFVMRMALGKQHPVPRIFQVAGPLHLEHGIFAECDIKSAGQHDYWIATCRWTYEKYPALGVEREHVFLSYAGTDIKRFGESPRGRLRRELGISEEVPLVGMVAYMYAPKRFLGQKQGLKGHEDFIDALSRVRKIRPDVRGVVIGGAWAGANWYEERVRELGRLCCNGSLDFLGTREDVSDLYPDLDLAVVPSHSENVGGAVESLLSGVPVVASKVGGLPDLVQEEKTGFVAPARDPEALAKVIVNALDHRDKARRFAAEGQKLARHLFDVERTGREVADIYRRILARSAPPN
jgi:glycosyltransferase involved in cell wall biosynthesis